MMRSHTFAATVAVVLSTLPACSIFMRSMKKPTATVRDVSISSAGFGGASGSRPRFPRIDVTLHFSTRVCEIDVAVNHNGSLGNSVARR